ncbi:MAG: hypothetical protein IPK32_18465 [Verrucomicrobiaceae bacterium]|nr:hypothetical protein [Verrucomicrobiaceae bacterium]
MIRGLLALGLAGMAQATTVVTLQPIADTHASAANAVTNYGSAGALAVSGSGNTKGAFQSVLRFDLASVKSTFDATYGAGNWTLDSLQLQLTAATPNNTIFNANAAGLILIEWLADDTWLENSTNWNSLPAVIAAGSESLGSFGYLGASSGTQLATLTSSLGFSADLSAGSTASFRLAAGDTLVSMVTNSRNFGTVANRPTLILTASPEPSRTLLTLLALSAVALHRRRYTAR